MTSQRAAWRTDGWSTSPWNHDRVTRAAPRFPASVRVHDSTLRDGERQPGVRFTPDDRIRIAEALAAVGVHRIEAGIPGRSAEDAAAVRSIVSRGLRSEIFGFARSAADVRAAVDAGVDGIVLELPRVPGSERTAGPVESQDGEADPAAGLAVAIEASLLAEEQGLRVSLLPLDSTRASVADYLAWVGAVARDGHLDALILSDTVGSLAPHAVDRFVGESRRRFNVPLEAHFHMDFGMGVANTLLAAAAGASIVHVTVGGLGPRAGHASLEETVVALRVLYDVDIGIHLEELAPLDDLVAGLARFPQARNHPITGSGIFDLELDGPPSGALPDARDAMRDHPFVPSLVGRSGFRFVVGRHTSPEMVRDWLGAAGVEVAPDDLDELLDRARGRIGPDAPIPVDTLLDVARGARERSPTAAR